MRFSAKRGICSVLLFLGFQLVSSLAVLTNSGGGWDIQPALNRSHGAGRSLCFCDLTTFHH